MVSSLLQITSFNARNVQKMQSAPKVIIYYSIPGIGDRTLRRQIYLNATTKMPASVETFRLVLQVIKENSVIPAENIIIPGIQENRLMSA